MTEVVTYTETQRNNYDPTHTTVLRNAFARAMTTRFKELVSVINTSIIKNDCFGSRLLVHQMNPAGQDAFAYRLSSAKIEAFMKWLKEQVDKGILNIGQYEQLGNALSSSWTNMYILDSYKRGVIRARYELRKLGFEIPSLEDVGGVDMLMTNPFHMDRVGILFARVFTDLRGITDAMDSIISRILAQGLIDGDNPRLLARKLVAAINGTGMGELGLTDKLGRFIPAATRAEILARTEIIRAHHLATIQEYRNWGLLNIVVKGEWKTAGDDRVCTECASLDGHVFTLDEIESMIPKHPRCRCIALPWIEELQKYKTKI